MKSESRCRGVGEGIDLGGVAPWEGALRLAHLPEMAFLDASLAGEGAVSAVAACPEEIIQGDDEPAWERLRAALRRRAGGPGMAVGYVEYGGRFRFGLYGMAMTYHHAEQRWEDAGGVARLLAEPAARREEPIPFHPEMAREDYLAIIRRAQEYIAAGDIYQVNLAHRFSGPWSGSLPAALGFYERLRKCSPAPHAALLCGPERIIASASPELFLRVRGREIITRPIKGTRPTAADAAADAASAGELLRSAKERAELVMITDLERNDLGQVCEYGSVHTRQLLQLERYAQVHHLVSTVAGTLRTDVDALQALRACFPGGSVTGAPKKRAMEIIAELEPAPRGLYTGAIGCLGYDGSATFNIAIRTAILERDGRAHFHAGAGIVSDSVPEQEWEETLWKAAGILRAAAAI